LLTLSGHYAQNPIIGSMSAMAILRQLSSAARNWFIVSSEAKPIPVVRRIHEVCENDQKENRAGCGRGLGSLLVGVALFAYYDFTHNFRFSLNPEQISDAQIALKGSIGEAIFRGQRSEVPDGQGEGKSGLDALLAPPPAGSNAVGLIEAYQKDPQRFKRYAEMLDTAMNAKQVGDLLLRQAASRLPPTSESLVMDPKLKVDAWGNPFCIIPVGERVAVVSGGPSRLSCDALPLNAQQIAGSNRSLYAGPSDVVVVVVTHQRNSTQYRHKKIPTGS
jgi:hypothetical protein